MSKAKKTFPDETNGPKAIPRDESFFKKLLNDPMSVADLYARPEDRDLCEPLVRALEDPDDLVRRVAVTALVMLDDLYAASSIFGIVIHGSVPARRAAVEVLGRIGKGDCLAAEYLLHALSDPDPAVREYSSEALNKLGIAVKKNPKSG